MSSCRMDLLLTFNFLIMKKIRLKEDPNGIRLGYNDMKKVIGGTVFRGHYCECRINLNEKTSSGQYVTVDLSNFMPNSSTESINQCSAACMSACEATPDCIFSAYAWGESGA